MCRYKIKHIGKRGGETDKPAFDISLNLVSINPRYVPHGGNSRHILPSFLEQRWVLKITLENKNKGIKYVGILFSTQNQKKKKHWTSLIWAIL